MRLLHRAESTEPAGPAAGQSGFSTTSIGLPRTSARSPRDADRARRLPARPGLHAARAMRPIATSEPTGRSAFGLAAENERLPRSR